MHPFCILMVKFRWISGGVRKTNPPAATPRITNHFDSIAHFMGHFDGQFPDRHPVHPRGV